MPIKKLLNALTGKKEETEQDKELVTQPTRLSDLFPVYRLSDVEISKYQKMPLSSIATLGAAFSQMPASARTVVETVTQTVATKERLFVEMNPKNISGFMRYNVFGTSGNIFQINQQGKNVIAGRMRYKPLEGLPINTTTTTTIPFDPVTMMIAVTLMNIEQKLADLQKIAEEILQFLKLEKQSKQRGNLNMLAEILEDFKKQPDNEDFLRLRNIEVQTIKREAHQDILFYQERISKELKEQNLIHVSQQAQSMLDAIMSEFYEYQLACYLYSFSSYLDVLLHKNFDETMLETTANRMQEHAGRYQELYQQCRTQIENYYQNSIDVKVLGGLGDFTKAVGNFIASVPVLRDGPVDELLINAGQSLSDNNSSELQKKLAQFAPLEDSRMGNFIDNIQTVNLMYNHPKAILTDGEDLYLLKT